MGSDKWTSAQLCDEMENLIRDLRKDGKGRGPISQEITRRSGRPCSGYAVEIAMQTLGLKSEGTAPHPIPIVDRSPTSNGDDGDQSIDDLIAQRIEASKRKAARSQIHNRTLEFPAEPFGLLAVGDPHVDNEGCDWESLFDHVSTARETEGVMGVCVGDMTDNWIGRLAKLYSKASVTASDGWKLSQWLPESMQWLAVVGGNHDEWAHVPGVDPLKTLSEQAKVWCYAPDEIRLTLTWKDSEADPLIFVIRHDFSGRSWYHATHGPHKEAMLDGKAHVLIAGHLHQWGCLTTEHRHQRVTHALRVRGYKRNDDFARAKGFPEQAFGESAFLVVDPLEVGPRRIQVFWDIEAGCRFLAWKRKEARK